MISSKYTVLYSMLMCLNLVCLIYSALFTQNKTTTNSIVAIFIHSHTQDFQNNQMVSSRRIIFDLYSFITTLIKGKRNKTVFSLISKHKTYKYLRLNDTGYCVNTRRRRVSKIDYNFACLLQSSRSLFTACAGKQKIFDVQIAKRQNNSENPVGKETSIHAFYRR